MSNWKVRLVGNVPQWLMVTSWFTSAICRLTEEAGAYFLTSSNFNNLESQFDVYNEARRLIVLVRGSVSIREREHLDIQVGSPIRINDDDTVTEYIILGGTIEAREYLTGTIAVGSPNGASRLPELSVWIEASQQNETAERALEKALRLADQGSTWDNLYRLYEVLEADLMRLNKIADTDTQAPEKVIQYIVSKGWAQGQELRLFRDIAQRPSKVGDEARHGHDPRKPEVPGNMTLAEADSLIRSILIPWIRSKSSDQIGEA